MCYQNNKLIKLFLSKYTSRLQTPNMELPKVEPVFLKAWDIPDYKTLEKYKLCEAIRKVIQKRKATGNTENWHVMEDLH